MRIFKRIILASFGMTILSIGIGFIVNSQFGSDILTLSIEAYQKIYPLSVGTYNFIYGFLMLLVTFVLDKKKIGYATLYYITVGVFLIDKSIEIIPIATTLYMKLLYVALAVILMSLSVGIAITVDMGLGYYDAFLYSVSEKINKSYVMCRYTLEILLLIISLILKTYPGIGTLIYILVLGPSINLSVRFLKKPIQKFIESSNDN